MRTNDYGSFMSNDTESQNLRDSIQKPMGTIPVPKIILLIGLGLQRLVGVLAFFLGMYNSSRVLVQNKGNIGFVEIILCVLLLALMIIGGMIFYKSFSKSKQASLRKLLGNRLVQLILVILYVCIITSMQ